jgi:hypothetical protein
VSTSSHHEERELFRGRTPAQRSPGAARIPGVPPMRFGTGRDCTHFAALDLAFRVAGLPEAEEWDYDALCALSGWAFRFQLSEQGWCPSSPHACCGWSCGDEAYHHLLPVHVEGLWLFQADEARKEAARAAVVAELDRDMPVPFGSEEGGVFVGYEEGGAVLLRRHPWDRADLPEEEYQAQRELPWAIGLLRRRAEPPDRAAALARLPELIRTLAAAEPRGGYQLGVPAWERWLRELRDEETLAGLEPAARQARVLGNAWIYECLVDARSVAARFLPAAAEEASGPLATALRKAANHYARVVEHLVPPQGGSAAVAPFPWMLPPGAEWSAEQRAEQARRLDAALREELSALRVLSAAA